MRLYIEDKGIELRLTAKEANVLAEYLKNVQPDKPQRHILNPAHLAERLATVSTWITKGIPHD